MLNQYLVPDFDDYLVVKQEKPLFGEIEVFEGDGCHVTNLILDSTGKVPCIVVSSFL